MGGRILLVGVLLVLAGCGSTTGGEHSTVTPAPVPEANDEQPVTPPPGIDDGRVTNVLALVDAHETALDGRAFRWTKTVTERRGENVTLKRRTLARVANTSHVRTVADGTGEPRTTAVFSNGDHTFVREANATSVHYRRQTTHADVPARSANALARVLLGVETSVERVSTDQGTAYLVTDADETAATLRALVTPDGLVRRVSATYEHSTADGRAQFESTIRPLEAPLTSPDWLPTARQRVNESAGA